MLLLSVLVARQGPVFPIKELKVEMEEFLYLVL
jgi:hypothetical protein